jgi:hypothetical protein
MKHVKGRGIKPLGRTHLKQIRAASSWVNCQTPNYHWLKIQQESHWRTHHDTQSLPLGLSPAYILKKEKDCRKGKQAV